MIRITPNHAFFFKEWPSNFRKTKFTWTSFCETHEFLCTEQAFMWAKAKFFGDETTAGDILAHGSDPMYCKACGRKVRNYDDSEWSKVRYDYMLLTNLERFRQDKELRAKLLDSKFEGKTFAEASPFDRIWGIGLAQDLAEEFIDNELNWPGKNLMGKVITEVRNRIKEEK